MIQRPQEPQYYWHVFYPSLQVNKLRWGGDGGDYLHWESGDYFLTEQEAQAFADKLKRLLAQSRKQRGLGK